MKLIGCQFDLVWENKRANFEKVRRLLGAANPLKGALVALPEMFATGFSMNVAEIAEPRGGVTEQFLAATAREFGVAILGGVVTPGRGNQGRNEAVVFTSEGKELARYTKMHCFNPSGEGDHYEAGNQPVVFPWADFKVAPFVCYDLRFPEIFRVTAAKGAQVLAVIANWPTARLQHWMVLLQARAIENQAYVIGVNRCGNTPKLAYAGRSLIIDPRGVILAEAGEQEGILSAELDLAGLEAYRKEFAVLPDMRAEYVKADAGSRREGV